ncbi:MAG: glycosyltransferase [Muribaculaceae bacterium]
MTKVVLLNHSDSLGGASVVTRRLTDALHSIGVEARMLVSHCSRPGDAAVITVGTPAARKLTFLAEHADIFVRNGFSRADLFKASTGKFGLDITGHPLVRDADVVCINWCNQGMLSLSGLQRLADMGKRIIWTMHDMWPMTGICHHAGECEAYHRSCGACPLVHWPAHEADLSRAVWRRKRRLYDATHITFVAVSHWLADRCRDSALLRDADVRVIPNAFPCESYNRPPRYTREQLGITDPDTPIIVFGAARLDDPIKGFGYAIDALNSLHRRGVKALAVFFGNIRDAALLQSIALPHCYLGPLDADKVHSLYCHSRVVLSTSLYETLPGTLIEGQAAGCIPVTFGRGGQADIVAHGVTGYIADYQSPESVAHYLAEALTAPIDAATLRASVADKFAPQVIARRYLDIF